MQTEDLISPTESGLFEVERRELDAVLKLALRPHSNMALMLRYVCEKSFAGLGHEIKEYNIAVEALGRPPDFDPSKDSIVRVEAHRLRSRLDRHYRQNPSPGSLRIQIPPGSYIPHFLRQGGQAVSAQTALSPIEIPATSEALEDPVDSLVRSDSEGRTESLTSGAAATPRKSPKILIAASIVLILLTAGSTLLIRHRLKSQSPGSLSSLPLTPPANAIRILAGVTSSTFIDAHGAAWMGDRYFVGGNAEGISPRTIAFADDSSIYNRRRRGEFAYDIPLRPGTYELRLYFADAFFGEGNPDGGGEGSRLFDVMANGEPILKDFDVISDAGGSNTADVKVFTDVRPGKDGFLHLKFVSKRDVAFLNAIEVLPSEPRKMIPVRIHMSRAGYSDQQGIHWESDRYYRGGVDLPSDVVPNSGTTLDQRIGERFGNFTYAIPVAPTGRYSVTMTFKDSRTPKTLGNPSQADPNVFNVYANGQTILDHFVVPTTASSAAITKTIPNLRPNAQGKLILSFVPVHNYAVVGSIEVIDQTQ